MIEIKEISDRKYMNENKHLGIFGDGDRTFSFVDRNDILGVIQFSVRHPQLAELISLNVSKTNSLADDLIVDGLVRTACHTFLRENISWIVTEKEMVNQNSLLATFFKPVSAMSEAIPDEILKEICKHHSKRHVLKTDMIYQGCCKGE